MKGLVLACVALCGCSSDPWSPGDCVDGNTRDPGPSCAAPLRTVQIDGDFSDWPSRDLLVARTADALFFRFAWSGLDDGAYSVQFFEGFVDEGNSREFLASARTDTGYVIENEIGVRGPVFLAKSKKSADGFTDIELSVPFASLPFKTGAFAWLRKWAPQGAQTLKLIDSEMVGWVCWDPEDRASPCNGSIAYRQ